jgi:hypothetical protein
MFPGGGGGGACCDLLKIWFDLHCGSANPAVESNLFKEYKFFQFYKNIIAVLKVSGGSNYFTKFISKANQLCKTVKILLKEILEQ